MTNWELYEDLRQELLYSDVTVSASEFEAKLVIVANFDVGLARDVLEWASYQKNMAAAMHEVVERLARKYRSAHALRCLGKADWWTFE